MFNNKKVITGLSPPIGRYSYLVENNCNLVPPPSPRKRKSNEKQLYMGEVISMLFIMMINAFHTPATTKMLPKLFDTDQEIQQLKSKRSIFNHETIINNYTFYGDDIIIHQ